MRDNFDRCIAVTLPFEGGLSMDKRDPGNWTGGKVGKGELKGTNHGIAAASYPNLDIKNLTVAQAGTIYKRSYWDALNGDTLAIGVDLATFDAGVNSGVSRARKWLYASAGGTDVETVKRLCGKRLGFMQSLKIWQTFKNGWSRRVASIEAKGVAWAVAASGKPAVKEVLAEEQKAATKQAGKNAKGAGGVGSGTVAGGGDIAINPQHVDAISGWIVGGLLVAGIALVVFLVARAVIHKHRADAFAAEAKAVGY